MQSFPLDPQRRIRTVASLVLAAEVVAIALSVWFARAEPTRAIGTAAAIVWLCDTLNLALVVMFPAVL